MTWLPDVLTYDLLAFCFAVTVCAGIVKGAVGFAMPLIMVVGLGMVLDPKLVVAGIILPTVLTNVMQIMRGGMETARQALRDFGLYIAIVCVMIFITAQFVTVIPTQVMYLVLGIPVTLLCAMQLAGFRLQVGPDKHRIASVIIGVISGVLGGLAGTWGPTTVLYLVALDTPKARQIAVQGVVYGIGAIVLLFGHLNSGILSRETIPFSVFLLLPAILGIRIGFMLHDRIDQATFRKMTLFVLLIAGLNLIRRGLI